MKPHSNPTTLHRDYGPSKLSHIALALLVVAGTAMSQTTAPVGTTKPAAYDCSGIEGVALANCKQLNTAAVQCAMLKNNSPSNSTHDCSGMTGAALATCLDLNGRAVQTYSPDAGGATSRPLAYGDLNCSGVDALTNDNSLISK